MLLIPFYLLSGADSVIPAQFQPVSNDIESYGAPAAPLLESYGSPQAPVAPAYQPAPTNNYEAPAPAPAYEEPAPAISAPAHMYDWFILKLF